MLAYRNLYAVEENFPPSDFKFKFTKCKGQSAFTQLFHSKKSQFFFLMKSCRFLLISLSSVSLFLFDSFSV